MVNDAKQAKSWYVVTVALILSVFPGRLVANGLQRYVLPVDFTGTEIKSIYLEGITENMLAVFRQSPFYGLPIADNCTDHIELGSLTLGNIRFEVPNKAAFGFLISEIGRLGTTRTYAGLIEIGARLLTKDDKSEFVTRMIEGKISGLNAKNKAPSERFNLYLRMWDLRNTADKALRTRRNWERSTLGQLLSLGASRENELGDDDRMEIVAFLRTLHSELGAEIFESEIFREEAMQPTNRDYYSVYFDGWPK